MKPDPKTSEQWQAAVDAAHALLALDSARQFGLVTGGPTVNVDRAVEILKLGAKRGFQPAPDDLDRMIAELNQP